MTTSLSSSANGRIDRLLTGVFYIGLAITGGLGFMMIRPQLFTPGDPAQTLANLLERTDLARTGIALEMGLATFQALASVWFAKLFRNTDPFAAGTLALFGMVNSIVVLASSALMGAALDVALAPTGFDASTSHLLMLISGRLWQVGNVFFGLWLIPMGWLVWKAEFGRGHRVFGWILVLGGVGYVVNAFVPVLAPNAGIWIAALPILATVGEFWMIGLLLWTGIRRPANSAKAA